MDLTQREILALSSFFPFFFSCWLEWWPSSYYFERGMTPLACPPLPQCMGSERAAFSSFSCVFTSHFALTHSLLIKFHTNKSLTHKKHVMSINHNNNYAIFIKSHNIWDANILKIMYFLLITSPLAGEEQLLDFYFQILYSFKE